MSVTETDNIREGQITIEYENLDLPPAYVESAQGMPSPQGVLHVSFFSERIASVEKLSGTAAFRDKSENTGHVGIRVGEPFGTDEGNIRLVRRVEANLIFTSETIRKLIPWLQNHLDSMEDSGDGK